MSQFAPCVICLKYIYYKNMYCNNYNWCDNCIYNLELFNDIYRLFYYNLIQLKHYPSELVSMIINDIIKFRKLINVTQNPIEVIGLYNKIIFNINILINKNQIYNRMLLKSNTQTFLCLLYK